MYYSKSVFFMLNFNSVRVYLQANYLFLKSYYSATRSPERNHFRHNYSLLRSQRGNQQRCQTSVFKVSKQLFKERKKREKSVPFRTTVRNRAGGETTSENYIIRSNISDRSSIEQINTPEESYIIHSCPNSNISRVVRKTNFPIRREISTRSNLHEKSFDTLPRVSPNPHTYIHTTEGTEASVEREIADFSTV